VPSIFKHRPEGQTSGAAKLKRYQRLEARKLCTESDDQREAVIEDQQSENSVAEGQQCNIVSTQEVSPGKICCIYILSSLT